MQSWKRHFSITQSAALLFVDLLYKIPTKYLKVNVYVYFSRNCIIIGKYISGCEHVLKHFTYCDVFVLLSLCSLSQVCSRK